MGERRRRRLYLLLGLVMLESQLFAVRMHDMKENKRKVNLKTHVPSGGDCGLKKESKKLG